MYAEQLMPHDAAAEDAVTGSILIDGDCYAGVSAIIGPDDFYRDRHRLIFTACRTLHDRNEGIDQVTVARELNRSNRLEDAGGMAYMSHLVSITPTSTHAEYYAKIVRNTSLHRQLIAAGSEIMEIGYGDSDDIDKSIGKAEEALYQVQGTSRSTGFVTIGQIFNEYLESQAALLNADSDPYIPILTGFNDLDELMGGFYRSDLIILGARPGVGKTALAVNLALNAAKDSRTIGIFSLEMSRNQLALRILACEAQVDAYRLRLGLYTESEEQRIINAIGELSDLDILIDDTPFQTAHQMAGKAKYQARTPKGLDLLIIDYLQLVQGPNSGNGRNNTNRVQEISEISRSMKLTAKALDIPVIGCSQLNRIVETRPGHRPRLSDLRESGSIEQDADIVMFIHREDMYYTIEEWEQNFPDRPYPDSTAEIIVAKHRHGERGSINLQFVSKLISFKPAEPVREYRQSELM